MILYLNVSREIVTIFFIEVKLQSEFSQTELYRLYHSFREFLVISIFIGFWIIDDTDNRVTFELNVQR